MRHKLPELSHIFSESLSGVSLPETLSPLEGHHMLVKTDNTSTVFYIYMDLFTLSNNMRWARFYSLRSAGAGHRRVSARLAARLAAFPPLALNPRTLSGIREYGHEVIPLAPHWPAMHWLAEIVSYCELSPGSSSCAGTCCCRHGWRSSTCTQSACCCGPGP